MANPIIVLFAIKGGGGKTTLAASIAGLLLQQKKAVALIDADPQRSLTEWHGAGGPLSEIPLVTDATGKAAARAVELSKKSIVIVDTPGFANREQLDLLAVADRVLIPCRPSALDARRAMEALEMVETVNSTRRKKAIAAVVMNAAIRSTIVGHIRNELVAGGARVLGAEIGQRTAYAEAELYGSAPCFMGRAAQKAADEVAAVTGEILRTS
jgi:chromosome partitioning protein